MGKAVLACGARPRGGDGSVWCDLAPRHAGLHEGNGVTFRTAQRATPAATAISRATLQTAYDALIVREAWYISRNYQTPDAIDRALRDLGAVLAKDARR